MSRFTAPSAFALAGSLLSLGLLADIPCVPLRYHHPLEGQSHSAAARPRPSAPQIAENPNRSIEWPSLLTRWNEDSASFKPGDLSDVAKQSRIRAWVLLTDRINDGILERPTNERAQWIDRLKTCAEHPDLIDAVRAICWKRWSAANASLNPAHATAEPAVPSRIAELSEII